MAESIAAWLFLLALLAALAVADKVTGSAWWARRVERGRTRRRSIERDIADFDAFITALRDARPVVFQIDHCTCGPHVVGGCACGHCAACANVTAGNPLYRSAA